MAGFDDIANQPSTLWVWSPELRSWVANKARPCKHHFSHGFDDGDGRKYSMCAWCDLRSYDDEDDTTTVTDKETP